MQFRMVVLAVVTILGLTALITDADAHCPLHPEDLIDCNEELARVIAPALTPEEQETVLMAMWQRQAHEAEAELPLHRLWSLDPHMAMAYAHVMHGGRLRIGDIVALHGALLSALRPDTYALAKKWQELMIMYTKCRDDIACNWF